MMASEDEKRKTKASAKNKKKKLKDKWGHPIQCSEEQAADDAELVEGEPEEEEVENQELAQFESRKVVVSGMPYSTTERQIRDLFKDVGEISQLQLSTFPDSGNFRGLAFVTFANEDLARKSLGLDGTKMENRFIRVEQCRLNSSRKRKNEFVDEPKKVEGCLSAYIGNLSWDVTEDEIRECFTTSKITSIRFAQDKRTGTFRGFGHIDFADDESLEEAMKMNQVEICTLGCVVFFEIRSLALNDVVPCERLAGETNFLLATLLFRFFCDHSYFVVSMVNSQSGDSESNGGHRGVKMGGSLVVCFGEMLIDFVPIDAGVSLSEAPAFKKAAGGAPANVAVGISRLGGSAAFIGKVGQDDFGHMLSNILKQNNVDNSGVCFDPDARTALAFVTLRADGEREFLFYRNPSADMLLCESELNVELIKRCSIFHYGSISLIQEPCRSTHLAAIDIAKRSGCLLSYDPNLRLPLWPSADAAREGILSIWDKADIIKVSEDEIAFLTGGEDPYDDNVVAKNLFHPNLKLLLVSEGKKGCRYYTQHFRGRVEGIEVKAVDTTGAGDAFVSGILSSFASNLNLYKDEQGLREALRFANACGALTVTARGAIPALPTKEAVLQALIKIA
ncbi:hypothetical protein H6P81_005028 [Aristolochia fimbriata]|uniref:fructokinase n=1 Tax=Aristolochia fimbriata TaxID=158543 RepID=A0AAV7EUQ9_ARIFI|nr:hypothetical protein H6P81_005028 [Aristolochia fimbriata]